MKLIDILVQELPKRGGWPLSAIHSWCDKDGEIRFRGDDCRTDFYPSLDVDISDRIPEMKFEDSREYVVTREQYEAALAASKPEWDGEGLPPVGCEFLFGTHQTKAKCIAVGRDVIFASTGNPDEKDGFYEEFVISIHHSEFRPISSEADKKRAEGVIALSRVDPQAMPFEYGDKHPDGSLIGPFWYELYDAIAAGKIPHIRID